MFTKNQCGRNDRCGGIVREDKRKSSGILVGGGWRVRVGGRAKRGGEGCDVREQKLGGSGGGGQLTQHSDVPRYELLC